MTVKMDVTVVTYEMDVTNETAVTSVTVDR